jgi:ubiquinone/menaquinone biosynthesis C-methylase UbiE
MSVVSYVCPWWAASFTINTPLRRWFHDPRKIVGPYVKPGMTAIDIGCGVGWFSVPMAEMVGERGKVVAVDLQQQMLDMLRRRAEKAGVADRIERHRCQQNRLGIGVEADFVLIFAMLHEVPDQARLLGEVRACLKAGGKLLLAEPPIHVTRRQFAGEVAVAERTGFRIVDRPKLRWSHAVLLEKGV